MKKKKFTWKAFWIRQLKLYVPSIPILIFMWNGVDYGRVIHEYLGWTFEGYGDPQQRWYRVITSGLIFMGLFGTLIDAINTWHYLKNPHEIPDNDADDESE